MQVQQKRHLRIAAGLQQLDQQIQRRSVQACVQEVRQRLDRVELLLCLRAALQLGIHVTSSKRETASQCDLTAYLAILSHAAFNLRLDRAELERCLEDVQVLFAFLSS